MAKQLQLSIPTPCHENWDSMTPVAKGKFCDSCQKQVVDFSTMSDRQVAEFFKKPSKGSVCGRFMSDQLERDIEIPTKRIPWVKYFFQFALPAFLVSLKTNSVKAQGEVMVKTVKKAAFKSPGLKADIDISACSKKVTGDTIIMPEVVITTVAKSETKGKVSTDITSLLQGKVSGPVITIVKKEASLMDRDLSLKLPMNTSMLQGRMGGVVVGVQVKVLETKKSKKEKKQTNPIPPLFKDTAFSSFKVYPNPVSAGSSFTIETKKQEEGYYNFELVNQSGQTVHQQKLWIDAEARLLSIDIPNVPAGSYFLVLINNKTGKKFTEKIIVQ